MKKVIFFIISFIFVLTIFNSKLINKLSVSATDKLVKSAPRAKTTRSHT